MGLSGVTERNQGDPNFMKKTIQLRCNVKYLLENCYFKLDKIFRQILGTPNGSNPDLSVLCKFVFIFLRKQVDQEKVKKIDVKRARRFANVARFIDCLTALKDGGEFEQSFKEIYPTEFVFKVENLSNKEGFF